MNQINPRQPYLTKSLTFVFLRIMRSVLLFRIKNCRCNSMAISPLKILIIFEIWSLGSGFFTHKQKRKKIPWELNYGSVKIQFMRSCSGMFPSPYSKACLVLGLKGHCFCPRCISPNLPEIKSFVFNNAGGRRLFKKKCILSLKAKGYGWHLTFCKLLFGLTVSPARGKLFYKWTCISMEAFRDRATKLQYFAWPCAELQHHSCKLQTLSRTTASRTRILIH